TMYRFGLQVGDSNNGSCSSLSTNKFHCNYNLDSTIFSFQTNIKGFKRHTSQGVTNINENRFASGIGVVYYYKKNQGNANASWSTSILKYCVLDRITYGDTTPVSITTNISEISASYSLSQNYPNPFNPSTNISFEIPHRERVSSREYNTFDQSVAELVNQDLSAGSYSYSFNASNLPSGVYFYKLTAGNEFVQTKKMLLIK